MLIIIEATTVAFRVQFWGEACVSAGARDSLRHLRNSGRGLSLGFPSG